jgi:hypothetical protein
MAHITATNTTDDGQFSTTAPRTASVCGAIGCPRTEDVAPVTRPDRGTRVLCPRHRRHFMGVSS